MKHRGREIHSESSDGTQTVRKEYKEHSWLSRILAGANELPVASYRYDANGAELSTSALGNRWMYTAASDIEE